MTGTRSAISRVWERVRTVPGLSRDLLIVTTMLALGIAVTVVMLSKTTFVSPFAQRFTFAAEFEQAPATNPDTTHTVTIAGVQVGNITGWRATQRGTAVMELDIDARHQLYDNARAVLRSTGPLNQMYIEINPGGPPGEPLPEGEVIPISQTDRPIQPDEVLDHLDERSQHALTALLAESDVALARAPEHLPGGLRAGEEALVGLRPVVEALRTRREHLAELTTALARIATTTGGNAERITRLADATQQTLAVLATNDAELRETLEQLPGLGDSLRTALTSTQELTEQLDPTLDNLHAASGELPAALTRLVDTTKRIGTTVDQARPVVDAARPVVANLRPLTKDLTVALDNTLPITERLERDTGIVLNYRDDISAFVFNTSSIMSVADARGPVVRGHLIVPLPDGGVLPGGRGGVPGSPDEHGRSGQGGR